MSTKTETESITLVHSASFTLKIDVTSALKRNKGFCGKCAFHRVSQSSRPTHALFHLSVTGRKLRFQGWPITFKRISFHLRVNVRWTLPCLRRDEIMLTHALDRGRQTLKRDQTELT